MLISNNLYQMYMINLRPVQSGYLQYANATLHTTVVITSYSKDLRCDMHILNLER